MEKSSIYLISQLNQALKPNLIDKVYNAEVIPTKYKQWKKCAVLLDQNWRKHQEVKKLSSQTHCTPATTTSATTTAVCPVFHCQPAPLVTTPTQPSPTIQQGQGQTFGGLRQPMDLGAA